MNASEGDFYEVTYTDGTIETVRGWNIRMIADSYSDPHHEPVKIERLPTVPTETVADLLEQLEERLANPEVAPRADGHGGVHYVDGDTLRAVVAALIRSSQGDSGH
jgi:hypothetical protein